MILALDNVKENFWTYLITLHTVRKYLQVLQPHFKSRHIAELITR